MEKTYNTIEKVYMVYQAGEDGGNNPDGRSRIGTRLKQAFPPQFPADMKSNSRRARTQRGFDDSVNSLVRERLQLATEQLRFQRCLQHWEGRRSTGIC